MCLNADKILSKLFFILIIFSWVGPLHANCSENETMALFLETMGEMKKGGFFDFKYTYTAPQENEIKYYFTAKKKDGFGDDQVYASLLVADTRDCNFLKSSSLERLRPFSVSDFKIEGMESEEECSLDKVKNIIFESLEKGPRWHLHYGSLMKSWEYYEFVYTMTNTDDSGAQIAEYLGRMEITKTSCYLKRNDMSVIRSLAGCKFPGAVPLECTR